MRAECMLVPVQPHHAVFARVRSLQCFAKELTAKIHNMHSLCVLLK